MTNDDYVRSLEQQLRWEQRQRTLEENSAITGHLLVVLSVASLAFVQSHAWELVWWKVALSVGAALFLGFSFMIVGNVVFDPIVNAVRDWWHRDEGPALSLEEIGKS